MRSVAGAVGVWLGLALSAAPALAQRAQPCTTCEECSALLAQPKANARLEGPIALSEGQVCVRILGAGARFDGGHHAMRGAAQVAVQVEAPEVWVRNLRVEGARVGLHTQAAETTVFASSFLDNEVGLRAEGAEGLRVERVRAQGGRIGIALGAPAEATQCAAGAALRNPGAVLQHVHLEGAQVGLSACEARPVLHGVVAVKNDLGALFNDPAPNPAGGPGADAAWDPCVCAPTLDAVQASTTLFYSSGCVACQVHEGWLPDLRARGADIRLRASRVAAYEAQGAFDRYAQRCAPALIDVLGIPGCVPNYACAATGARFKSRDAQGQLQQSVRLQSADALAAYAAQCATQAQLDYTPSEASCVKHAVRESYFCGNRSGDLAGPAPHGARNVCEGGDAALGCAPCEGQPVPSIDDRPEGAPANPAPANPTPASATPPSAPESAPASAPESVASAAPQSTPSGSAQAPAENRDNLWIVLGALGLLSLGILLGRTGKKKR